MVEARGAPAPAPPASTQSTDMTIHRKRGRLQRTTGRKGSIQVEVPPRLRHVTHGEILAEMRRMLSRVALRPDRIGDWALDRFRGWRLSITARGLRVMARLPTHRALMQNIDRMQRSLGQWPGAGDFWWPRSKFSLQLYEQRYGSMERARDRWASWSGIRAPSKVRGARDKSRRGGRGRGRRMRESRSKREQRSVGAIVPMVRRHIGARLRFHVFQRDRFRCQACGRSPAIDGGVVLQIDHRIPHSRGGGNEQDNLQTLCQLCNTGKGNRMPKRM